VIAAHLRIIGHQQKRLGLRLGNQQPVERITVMARQMPYRSGMNAGKDYTEWRRIIVRLQGATVGA